MNPTAGSDVADGSLDRYLREIAKYPLIDRAEEARLAQGIREGSKGALDKLVCSNLRFVVSVSKEYQNRGVPLPDLINEGNVGLIRAAQKFDETRGVKFISYAVWWIRQAIRQALAEQSNIVRLPVSRAAALGRIAQNAARLRADLGREPTAEELAEASDASVEEIEVAAAATRPAMSLDGPVDGESDGRLTDCLPDTMSPSPEDAAMGRALADAISEALAALGEREAMVLRHYFGLDGETPKPMEEIGGIMGVTRERVRQIKESALCELRSHRQARRLETFATP